MNFPVTSTDRSITVEGKLTEALVERLRPEILELTARSREPITVFINGRGGSTEIHEAILALLRRTNEAAEKPCRIITIATSEACSASANLLSAGDFAIACPETTLLYHGGRWPLADLVAAGECGLLYARTLPTFHERNAAALARACVRRFLFVVSAERALFAQHRADTGDMALTDLACFQAILRGELSLAAQKAWDRAIRLCDGYNNLLWHFQKRLRRGRTVTDAHIRKLMLHASIAFEYETSKGDGWHGGLDRISDHFAFLNNYFDLETLRDFVAGREAPHTADETDALTDELLPFRLFSLAIARALQDGENYITPVDAVWLGLIDTVWSRARAQSACESRSFTSW